METLIDNIPNIQNAHPILLKFGIASKNGDWIWRKSKLRQASHNEINILNWLCDFSWITA